MWRKHQTPRPLHQNKPGKMLIAENTRAAQKLLSLIFLLDMGKPVMVEIFNEANFSGTNQG